MVNYVNASHQNDGTVGAGASVHGERMRSRGTLNLSVETSDICYVAVPYKLPQDLVVPIEALDPHI
jgi:hypothetical protein